MPRYTLFSVIIPTYNRAEKLKRALESLVNQTYKNFEVIVCDDGSIDDTPLVVESFKNQLDIHYLYEENWGGPARPRNRGIRASRGEWICFLDADDWWIPSKLEKSFEYTNSNDFIYHRLFKYHEGTGEVIGRLKSINLGEEDTFYKLLIHFNPVPASSVVVRKEKVIKSGLFNENKELIASEDFELWLKISLNHARFKFIKEDLGYYSIGEDNISSSMKEGIRRNHLIYSNFEKNLTSKQKAKIENLLTYQRRVLCLKQTNLINNINSIFSDELLLSQRVKLLIHMILKTK